MELMSMLMLGGGVGGFVLLANWFVNGKGGKIPKIKGIDLHNALQKKTEEKIQSISTTQAKIEVAIKKKEEDIPVQSQEMIRTIANKAAKDISKIMEEKDPTIIQNEYNKMMGF